MIPRVSPRYPTEAAIEARNKASLKAESSNIHQRMPELDERLKTLYVDSKGDNPVLKTKRKLPEDRSAVIDPEFGYVEPAYVTPGKLTLRLAVEMINSYKDDPDTNDAKALSKRYKLDLESTYLILEYFQPFNLKLPKPEALSQNTDRMLQWKKLNEARRIVAQAEDIMNKSGPKNQ